MKTHRLNAFTATLCFVAGLAIAATANATPIEYQITGTLGAEWVGDVVQLDASQYPLPVGTPFSGTFFYDSSVPPSDGRAVGALSNLAITLGDFQASATTGNVTFTASLDLTFGKTITTTGIDGFSGFTANGFTLQGIDVLFSSFPATLPSDLAQQPPALAAFAFASPTSPGVTYSFLSSFNPVSEVPLPSAAILLGSGLLGLAGVSRRRAA